MCFFGKLCCNEDADDADNADEAYVGECTCGAKKGNKIVGGEEASVGWITFFSIIFIMNGVRIQHRLQEWKCKPSRNLI